MAQKHLFPWDTRPLHPPLLWQKSKGLKHVTFYKVYDIKWTGTGEALTAVLHPLIQIRDPTQVSPKAQMGGIWSLTGPQTQKTRYLTVPSGRPTKHHHLCYRAERCLTQLQKLLSTMCTKVAHKNVDLQQLTLLQLFSKVTHTYSLQTQRKFFFLRWSLLSSII